MRLTKMIQINGTQRERQSNAQKKIDEIQRKLSQEWKIKLAIKDKSE